MSPNAPTVIIRQPEREDKGHPRLDSAVSSIIFRAMSVTSELRRRVRAERSLSRYEPCLPRPAKQPPAGTGWIHEIKHDGFRILAQRDANRIRLLTRNSYDFSERYPLIVAAVEALPAVSCVLDGEAIACDGRGLSVFDMIRWRQHDNAVTLCAFDLLELDGEDLRREPIRGSESDPKGAAAPSSPRHRVQPPFRRRRRYRLRTGLRARLRGHRIETPWVTIPTGA